MSVKRVLPADVYDALELSALVHGGIGGGTFGMLGDRPSNSMWESSDCGTPRCIHGHAIWITGDHFTSIRAVISDAEIGMKVNDDAVARINARLGTPDYYTRVPFADWCAELGVERGE